MIDLKYIEESVKRVLKENKDTKDYLVDAFINVSSFRPYIKHASLDIIINSIPQLKNNKIVGFLGGGLFGVVFELSNGWVLKIYYDSLLGGKDPQYQNYEKDLYSNKTNRSMLAVYDQGQIDFPSQINLPPLYWAVENKVIPILKWLEMTGRKEPNTIDRVNRICQYVLDIVETIEDLENTTGKKINSFKEIKYFYNSKHPVVINMINYTKRTFAKMFKVGLLTKKELVAIFKTVMELKKKGIRLQDFHSGNFGVDPTSKPDKPVIVIYDN